MLHLKQVICGSVVPLPIFLFINCFTKGGWNQRYQDNVLKEEVKYFFLSFFIVDLLTMPQMLL